MSVRINQKLTFIHIGKNAGTSITNLVDEKFQTQHSAGTHDTFDQTPKAWQDNCFCVIRNPYDRLLSLYNFTIQKMKKLYNDRPNKKIFYQSQFDVLEKGFKNFVLNEAETTFYTKPVNMNRKQSWSEKTQVRFFPTNKDKKKIKILRFENLQSDWKELCEKEGLRYHKLPRNNTSRADCLYREHYSKKMIDVVEKYWSKDIELGSYEF